jgi:thiamine-monophosphate kinase
MTSDATVREIGEFGLIRALRDALPASVRTNDRLSVAIGDDAAVWTPTPGASVVVTTDSLIEEVHFRLAPGWTDWRSLGHKALAVNLSDLAAMGAIPGLATVGIGLRGTERIADLVALYEGMGALANRWSCLIAGGDIVASPAEFSLHITAIGEANGGRVLRRDGARPGDVIAVSGTLGAAAAGLALLQTDPADPRRAATTADLLITAHLRPTPRLDLSPILVEHGATSAMDLSDGLFGDLPKILEASGVSARIDEDAIPVAAAVRALFPDRWFDLATRGGEDYELLFTAPPDQFATIVSAATEIHATATAIGEVMSPAFDHTRLELRRADGTTMAVKTGAFDHFAARPADRHRPPDG